MTENRNRCVVTGLGLVCAAGNSVEESWASVIAGKNGIRELKSVDIEGCYATVGAEVTAQDLDSAKGSEQMDRVSKLCVKASREAVADAGLTFEGEDALRTGVIMGSCVGGAVSIEHYYQNGEPASDIGKMTIAPIANHVASQFGLGGIVTNVANACAAGTISIAYACELIRAGEGDAFIVGGADAFAAVPYAGFLSLHALDADGCSPFNRSTGISLGEGSGALVVESYEHAVRRGAKIYCEILGSGISSDAHHITAPRPDGEGQMNAIRRAISTSGITPADIGYINAHGTGTAKNDEAEFLSLHTIFDEENDKLHVSSTKSMVGHCLGAAGAIEAVFTVKALESGVIPPTIGYSEEDVARLAERAGKIDFMPNVAKNAELTYVMSNSFAFGGNNASIIFASEPGNVTLPASRERIFLSGVGIVSSVGNGKEAYIAAVKANDTPSASHVFAGVGKEDFDKLGIKMAFYRKLDKFSQLQAVSGMDAIADSGIVIDDITATGTGIIVGTADGPVATVCDFERDLVAKGNPAGSAFKFPNTVYNAAGGYLSICSGIKGYNVTVTNGAQSGLAGVAYAMNVIRQGGGHTMLATGTDENCEIIGELYEKEGLVAKEVRAPYTPGDGITLSEGSISLVLESGSRIAERGGIPYAELVGYGMSHATGAGSSEGAEALARAIRLAFADAGVSSDDISLILGLGNGSAALDTLEMAVYSDIFRSEPIPVLNVRGITGDARAASAALSLGHAALLLSGALGESASGILPSGETVTLNTAEACYVLTVAASDLGSYTAVIAKRVH